MRWFDIVYAGDTACDDDSLNPAPRVQVLWDDDPFCTVDVLVARDVLETGVPGAAAVERADAVRAAMALFVAPFLEAAIRECRIGPGARGIVRIADVPAASSALLQCGAKAFVTFLRDTPGARMPGRGEVVHRFAVDHPDVSA